VAVSLPEGVTFVSIVQSPIAADPEDPEDPDPPLEDQTEAAPVATAFHVFASHVLIDPDFPVSVVVAFAFRFRVQASIIDTRATRPLIAVFRNEIYDARVRT
jgi:hypothetical protein